MRYYFLELRLTPINPDDFISFKKSTGKKIKTPAASLDQSFELGMINSRKNFSRSIPELEQAGFVQLSCSAGIFINKHKNSISSFKERSKTQTLLCDGESTY